MASTAGIIKKVSALLKKVGPPVRLAYARSTTRTGGDILTGNPGVVTTFDTLFSPQPFCQRMGRDRIPGGHTKAEDANIGDGTTKVLDDWLFYFSPAALSLQLLQSPDFLIVLKTPGVVSTFGAPPFGSSTESLTGWDEEVLRLIDAENVSIYGGDVLRTVYMRSIKRT